METLASQLNKLELNEQKLFRFKIFTGTEDESGKLLNRKTVGMAYLMEGHHSYVLRLWTFLQEKFYLFPCKHDSNKYLVVTKEKNKNEHARVKNFSNIVGSGQILSAPGLIRIDFDLLGRAIYLNTMPEAQALGVNLPPPRMEEALG